jgi:hypothetical protein
MVVVLIGAEVAATRSLGRGAFDASTVGVKPSSIRKNP